MALDALVLRGLRADDERHSGLPLDLITGTGAARGVYTVVGGGGGRWPCVLR